MKFSKYLTIILCSWLSLIFASQSVQAQLEDPLYVDIPFTRRDILRAQNLADQIKKMYPEDRYHYIFVGRSLTLARALFELEGLQHTGLPFSGKSIDLSFASPFGTELKPKLLSHLNRYLPRPSDFEGKELVLLDYTASGHGLETAKKTLYWYYDQQYPLHLLRVSSQGPFLFSFIRQLSGNYSDKTITIDEDSMLAKHFNQSNFDSYAGYGSFNVETARSRDFDDNIGARFEALKHWILTIKPSVFQSYTSSCASYLN